MALRNERKGDDTFPTRRSWRGSPKGSTEEEQRMPCETKDVSYDDTG